jgi:hypothetical protein
MLYSPPSSSDACSSGHHASSQALADTGMFPTVLWVPSGLSTSMRPSRSTQKTLPSGATWMNSGSLVSVLNTSYSTPVANLYVWA